ncbi:MAG: InlB B-repeat-containing protein, partial [Defluviitaleaceae bacterium]|nr:InlB B-repeat-containing protein [Defluviitaleaceae bacterium]
MKNITKKILAFLIAFTMIIPLFLAFQIYQVEATATYTHLNRQELARELIRRHNNQQILIMGAWGSMSTVAGTTSICNIRQTAEGRMATTGIPSGQTTPIANTYLSEDLLRAILMLNDRFGRFQINSIAGGRHSRNSNHYRGRAVDFQFLGVYRPANIPVNARQNNWSVITFLREHGFILENYFGDAHHFHIGILGYNPRGGIVATPPTVQVTRNVMIIYNANGGMDAPPNLTVTLDMSGVARFSHSVTRPFKEGYRFNGWLLNNDSRYPIQVHGGLSTINTNIIDGDSFEFFAQWSPVELGTVTIIYNANGGNNAPSNQTVALDNNGFARFNHPTTTPTRNGYTFLGWQIYDDSRYPIEPAGASAGVNTGSTTGGGSFEFFAQWSPLVLGTVTIIYNANGGSNAPPSQAVTLDSDGVARFNHP